MKGILEKILEIESSLSQQKVNDLSLLLGSTGIAIFYAHLYELTGDSSFLKKCNSIIDTTIKRLSRVLITHSFCSGFTGVAWGINYLLKKGFIGPYDEDIFEQLDDMIYHTSEDCLSIGKYDFLHGGIGAALYALERVHTERARLFISHFINEIDRIKIIDESGLKWEDSDFLNNPGKAGARLYNLGFAHGIPSIVETLRRINQAGLFPEETKKLITGGIEFTRSCRITDMKSVSAFPSNVRDDLRRNPIPTNLSWCYGDLMIANVLWKCGRDFGITEWQTQATDLMTKSTTRFESFNYQYLDACFCHGSSGVAHLFKSYYNLTGITKFQDTSELWIEKTLALARHQSGPAGFRQYRFYEKDQKTIHRWRNCYGVLEGVAGIGLVLITQLNGLSEWDNCLLVS
ncbi:Lanthionine synthetase C-like protein [Chitinophaga sp. YR573]|uniref:lanthionine synthetase C family protein n=1 Tax=Chitinophaga sp. YR573 TaxID=1881040 RepID=UPI0008B9342D|nr:lanthionine synthetase C family protein [Chitinophaga sp. YR573]SEW17795.1 Lanthionine synthetase C-like protein [Chitinophaga sp. YR573]